MNLAIPPFDDVHVRRAVNFAIDKVGVMEGILAERNRDPSRLRNNVGAVAHHAFPDSVESGLLIGYDPYPSAGDRGDPARARQEMALSKYDTDGDGTCDAAACRGILAAYAFRPPAETVRANLARIGLELDLREVSEDLDMSYPATRVAMSINWFLWVSAPDGFGMSVLLRGGDQLTDESGFSANQALVGATPEQLQEWGYEISQVPSLDRKISACSRSVSQLRFRCWAELDKLASEQVVPWVPIFSLRFAWIVSPRLDRVELGQSDHGYPAIDQVSLKPGS
jgi:ABC-type transport system substrate-binding protein